MSDLLRLQDATTFLFVPGSRPDRFDKAVASGADVVILDLEDAVAPREKDQARSHVSAWLAAGGRAAVRVNPVGSAWFAADVAAVGSALAVVLPKAESDDDLRHVAMQAQGPTRVVPLVETARGVMAVQQICSAPGVVRIGFGNIDLAADLGVQPTCRPALMAARSQLVYASRAASLAGPIDGVTTKLGDDEALADDARHGRDLGFTAKLTIHPGQVPIVADVFDATQRELDWAFAVLRTVRDGVGVHDGDMVDEPVLARARSILRRAGHDAPATENGAVP
jgi:citrate lyase subunit beta/citryl-CoA lyase